MTKKRIIVFVFLSFLFLFACFFCVLLFKYPTSYKDEIKKYSKMYNLSTSMVASVIKIESDYNSDSISNAGAMGLMQILPSTAFDMADRMGLDITQEDLFDPDTNINIGCYYLRYLLDMFDENLTNTLSAYNWGLSNVKTWMLKGNTDSGGSVCNLPVKETENYLKKYKKAKFMYSNIFGYDV